MRRIWRGCMFAETFATAASIALKVAFKRQPGKVPTGGNGSVAGTQPKVAWADMTDEPSSAGAGETGATPIQLAAMPHNGFSKGGRGNYNGGNGGSSGSFDYPPRLPAKLRRKLMAENRCLVCHEVGHFWHDCPMKD